MTNSSASLDRITLGNANKFKLGVFGTNTSSGAGLPIDVPERWVPDWASTVRVTTLADERGLDFTLPVARWKGFGGKVDPAGTSYEPIAWACALLGKTKRIHIFATVHALFIHPVFAAKQFVTADHVGEGRFGLNLVAGWNGNEFEMFGVKPDMENRYNYAAEWLQCIKRLWSEEGTFDFDGKFFQLKGLRADPGPSGNSRPVVLNAGKSSMGEAFAIDHCDGLFSSPIQGGDFEVFTRTVADVKKRAAEKGVPYPIFTPTTIICRRTQKEADDFFNYLAENTDLEALGNISSVRSQAGKKVPTREEAIKRGFGGFRIVGDADHVAKEFAKLHSVGVDGAAMIFLNQDLELEFFLDEVVPRLERMGLRAPFNPS